jgi:hypothetical protein
VDHGQDEGFKERRNSNVGGGYGGGRTEFENSEKEGHGWGGKKKKRCIFQRLPSAAILLAALVVAVLGLSSFASAVPILAKELDTPGAAAMATSTAGDIIPVKQAASDYSQPLLKQVGDMLDSSKASLRALTTAGETTESSQEMDIAVVELDVIAKSPRYKNDGGVDEFQEMSAIMTLLKNHLSDPDFISSLPEQMRNSMQMLQQEMTNAERAMGQIESIIGSSQIDSSSSRRSTMDRSANANSVKREYEESITSQRRVLNEGGTTDQYEQDANQEDSTFHQGEGSSSSFPFQHQTDARRNQEKLDELLNGQGQGRHARARMNWQGDQSRRRLNEDTAFVPVLKMQNCKWSRKMHSAQGLLNVPRTTVSTTYSSTCMGMISILPQVLSTKEFAVLTKSICGINCRESRA